MELTGKAKEQFEKWLFDNNKTRCILGESSVVFDGMVVPFRKIPESMQWGVIQDFADNLEWHIEVKYEIAYKQFRCEVMSPYHGGSSFPIKGTRQEARNAAIKKLNEIINEE
jgi:hypothetical protein